MPDSVLTIYQNNAAYGRQQAAFYDKRINTCSLLRLLLFAAMAVAVALGIHLDNFTLIAAAFVVLGFAFASVVGRQSKFGQQKQYFENYARVNDNEVQSLSMQPNLYGNGSRFAQDKHFYLADLDIFGPASLFQLCSRAATAAGAARLAGWLSQAAAKPVIKQRQQAVKELAAKSNWKLDVQTQLLFSLNRPENELPQLLLFLKHPLMIKGERVLTLYGKIIFYVLLAAIVLGFWFPAAKTVAISLVVLNFLLTFAYAGITKKAAQVSDRIARVIDGYAQVFGKIEQEGWEAGLNQSLAGRLKNTGPVPVSAAIQQLAKLIHNLEVNTNPFISFFTNTLALWNIKQVIAIEQWKRTHQANFETAFDVLAGFEALLSLAGLAINYPGWAFPTIADGDAYTLTATGVAHPLIPAASRVANDYQLANSHRIDLITGSNMAGKSTFLRTLGINTVLALSGAPVCAEAMEVSVMQLFTYMRIKDSLNESTSTFKAELDRLQLLLQTVEKPGKVFFLIDEMLRGTNSADKYSGSKAVIERLIQLQGTGLVATHDLQLAGLEQQYPHYIRNFYFDIQITNGEMQFDYQLKPGECKTFNASLLLKQIGIDTGPLTP